MRTTLDLDDQLMKQAKMSAVEHGETLSRLIERALQKMLRQPRPKPAFRLELLTKKGIAAAGVDWDDRDSLYERMEGRA
jgi:Family of unknown function (DUF6364)